MSDRALKTSRSIQGLSQTMSRILHYVREGTI